MNKTNSEKIDDIPDKDHDIQEELIKEELEKEKLIKEESENDHDIPKAPDLCEKACDIQENMELHQETHAIPDYIKDAVYEAQILVSYIARYSPVTVDREATETLIKAKYKIEEDKWGPEEELLFWDSYDKVASSIEPVTIESLKATMPDPFEKKTDKKKIWGKKETDAARSVVKYRLITAFALIVLLFAQIYWINGSDLKSKLESLFKKIDKASFNIEKRKQDKNYEDIERDIEINKLNDQKKKLIQEFGATYQLLQEWNRFWQIATFRKQFKAEVTNYVQQKYEEDIGSMQKQMTELEYLLKTEGLAPNIKEEQVKMLDKLKFEQKKRKFAHAFDKERNKLFLTAISADFVIRSLQVYVLPLLYGLLGAIIYTLRNLAFEIKNLTYTHHSETKYRLRITMGLLGGMAIGWFLKPDELSLSGSLSPMALSFLVGYNVEVFFALMDKFIDAISKFSPVKPEPKKE
jgi:hypothetical protein